MMMMESIGFN